MLIRLFILSCLLIGFSIPSAEAQHDPFEAGSGEGSLGGELHRRADERDEAKSFSGSIERLLNMAGEDASSSGHWKEFENVQGTAAEEKYHTTMEWKMERENKKAVSKKKKFDSTLDDVSNHLDSIRPTKARQRREHMMDHH